MHHQRIDINPDVMFGKPVIKATRVTVEQILRELARGLSPREIVDAYSRLAMEDIRAAEAFVADYLAQEISYG